MLRQLSRMFASQVTLLAVYWLYSLVVVPLIEPEAVARPQNTATDLAAEDNRLSTQLDRLRPFFEADAPELHDPIVLESPTFSLLLKDYRTLSDRRIEIKPCTLVFFPDGWPPPPGQRPRAVIMRAPGGAVLDFDEECDLARAKIGRLLGGRLVGEVTIRGNLGRGADPADPSGELFVTTHDVQLSQERIWTPHDVQFRLGPNRGSGSDMQIMLARPAAGSVASRHAVPHGIESFQLMHDVRLTAMVAAGGLLPGQDAPAAAPAGRPSGPPRPGAGGETPLEIRCQGPFRFDMVDYVATFEDRVDVVRMNPAGPSDQLNCELLAIYFARDLKAANAPAPLVGPPGAASLKSFSATKIEARGNPVQVRAPSAQAEARGEHLEYDLRTCGLRIEGDQPVWLHYGSQQIVARLVRYTPGPPGHAPEIHAEGQGRLNATLPGSSPQPIEVTWSRQLALRPHEGKQLLSVLGNARVACAETGSMTAEEIWLWLVEPPQAAAVARGAAGAARPPNGAVGAGVGPLAGRFLPHSLLARGKVHIDSPRLEGQTDQLEVWFQQGLGMTGQPAGDRTAGPLLGGGAGGNARGPASRYEFAGRLARMQLVFQGCQLAVRDVAISGGVTLAEHPPAGTAEKPLGLVGDELQLQAADSPDTTLAVTGRPARVEARGLALAGATIQLDKAANRLWIDGAGEMTLPVANDLQGRPAQAPQSLTISFARGMTFDGRTARYEGPVVARGEQQRLDTAQITVELVEPIDFGRPSPPKRPEVRQINCVGGVRLENRTLEQGRLVSLDRMEALDLAIDQQSGDLRAAGPGWVSTVRTQQAAPPGQGLLGQAAIRPAAPAAPARVPKSVLSYIRVRFQQAITGNIKRREVTFADQIRCIYGPVADWNDQIVTDRAAELTPDQALMTCDRLMATDLGLAGGGGRAVEMQATGHARVEGQTFAAEGDRLTYAAEKQLLVLEGTGQSDAHLWRQQRSGEPASHAAARKILFWRATNRVEVHDARFLDLNQLGRAP